MKKLILLAGVAALAACTQAEPEAADADATAMEDTATVAENTDAGLFSVTYPDGTTGQVQINEDWTYSDTDGTGAVTTGTWARNETGQMCFDAEGDAGPACFTDGEPGEDGSWTATDDEGNAVTVMRVEEVAEEAM